MASDTTSEHVPEILRAELWSHPLTSFLKELARRPWDQPRRGIGRPRECLLLARWEGTGQRGDMALGGPGKVGQRASLRTRVASHRTMAKRPEGCQPTWLLTGTLRGFGNGAFLHDLGILKVTKSPRWVQHGGGTDRQLRAGSLGRLMERRPP